MKQGSILIYSLLIMSVILAISLSLNAAFLRNLGNIREAQDSVRALYAADSGVEYCLYEARTGQEARGIFENSEEQEGTNGEYFFKLPEDFGGRSAEFKITNLEASAADFGENESVNDCLRLQSDNAFDIRATGTFGAANRSLEISYE
jgi:hypothetical protein